MKFLLKSTTLFVTSLFWVLSSCKKKDSTPSPATSSATVYFYFRASIDGQQIDYEMKPIIGNVYTNGMTSHKYNYMTTSFFKISSNIDVDDSIFVSVGFNLDTLNDEFSRNSYDYMINTGSKTFATAEKQKNKVFVTWYDYSSNTIWRSDLGPQTSSVFNLTSVIDNQYDPSQETSTFTANFSCILYNEKDISKTKILSSGSVKGEIFKYSSVNNF